MSKAGQKNFTGISAQADIALFYLLQSCNSPDFKRIIIEGEKWEDFTLVFDDRNEDFEVKWHNKPVSYNITKKIIEKELKKEYGKNDVLKIVVKKLSKELKADYDCFREYQTFLSAFRWEDRKQQRVIKNFLQRNWSEKEIDFLTRTEITELESDQYVNERMSEYFALEDPFYLSPQDQESIIAQSFRTILKKGAKGGYINRQDFLGTLDKFKEEIAKKSESFSPEITIRNKVENIARFLQSETQFKGLDHAKYLSAISRNPRLIFYICDNLEKNDFEGGAFQFFIDKILIKRRYAGLATRLLEKKWEQKRVDPCYLLDFIIQNYDKLFYSFNRDHALTILLDIAKKR